MFITDENELHKAYTQAKDEAREWKRDYGEFERLADNELLTDLDEALPEINDGTLSAALFKLPKRIVSSKLTGRPKTLDRDDPWLVELAKIQWENNIVKNANTQAPFHRKWKDAVRKSAIYGGIPIVTIFTERGSYVGSDFIVASAYDVTLEPGKVSDYDSDVVFWDVYYSDIQLGNMIEMAEKEMADTPEGEESYNLWDLETLKEVLKNGQKEDRTSEDLPDKLDSKAVERGGHHFYISYQRGVDAPFYMCHTQTQKIVRTWSNPDPTGDIPVHYLYCYQDFINPYGIGIVKLAGGTQNALDYLAKADLLATQLGIRPPKKISGSTDGLDEDSLVYAEDANWYIGDAQVERMELANGVYSQLPTRIEMLKSSLNKLLPMGDTSVSAGAGDPLQSKTPAGVKMAAASLSIDDDDFKDNLYITYEAVARSMINTHFANMQGSDLMKLSDDEREILTKAGINFPLNEEGKPSNEIEVWWDTVRAEFDFEIEPEVDKEAEDKEKLDGLVQVAQLRASDPMFDQKLAMSGKRIDDGELYSEIIALTTDNDKIIVEVAGEDMGMGVDPMTGQPNPMAEQDPQVMAEAQANIQAVMQQYGVDEQTAAAALDAEAQGYPVEEIMATLKGAGAPNATA